jgi:hypothetical protein
MPSDGAQKAKSYLGRYVQAPVGEDLKDSLIGYNGIQAYVPIMETIWKLHSEQPGQWFGSKYRINSFRDGVDDIDAGDEAEDVPVEPNATVELNDTKGGADKQEVRAHMKICHLLNPIHFLEGRYSFPKFNKLPWHDKPYRSAIQKLQSPFNQAYVDTLAMYLLGKLAEDDISPHFLPFYGAVTAIAEEYIYNITDDYPSYRNEPWFWRGLKNKGIPFSIKNKYDPSESVPEEVVEAITTPPTDVDFDATSNDDEGSIVSLPTDGQLRSSAELVDDALLEETCDIATVSTVSSHGEEEDEDEEDGEDGSDADSTGSEIRIGLEFKDMPVLLAFQKEADGVMDDLLFDEEEVGSEPGKKAWEDRWTAWLFQVCAALSQMQGIYNMTHNDLHTNNIVWTETDKTHIFYKSPCGKKTYKVPTYGKMFHIIDFGRAIFRVGHRQWVSDDYTGDNDAAGQYNFGPIFNPRKPKVAPNMSFDLTRLAVSALEEIFPDQPPKKKKGPTKLSEEPGRTTWETTSPLWNMMWTWLLTDKGENVLWDPDGEDRFPDFRLYEVIARECHGAVPSEQFAKPAFAAFEVGAAAVPEGVKVYNLY